jgi:hypothetical protein
LLPLCCHPVTVPQPASCTIASMSITNTTQEAVMGTPIPAQHPAVVLGSRYRNLRSLVAVLLVAIAALTTTVVILSVDSGTTISQAGSRSYPTLADSFQSQTEQPRPQGGSNESSVAAAISQPHAVSAPDESKIAASLAKHADTGPQDRERASQENDQAFVDGH